jgi:cytochrome c peroxidase
MRPPRRARLRLIAAATCCALLCAATGPPVAADDQPAALTPEQIAIVLSLSPLAEPRRDATNAVDGDAAAITLGERLFFDPRLSGGGETACSTCHDPAQSWTDGRPVAVGAGVGRRNTPALWNVAHNRWFFWDGRADSLWSQTLQPIEDGLEMDGSRLETAHLVAGDPTLRAAYEGLFGALPDLSDRAHFPAAGGPQAADGERQLGWWTMASADQTTVNAIFANVGKAIAAFVATIATGPAPFDRFVAELRAGESDSSALSTSARNGLAIFAGKGNCVLCHSGPRFTNDEFHDIRVPPRPDAESLDPGRLHGAARLFGSEFVAMGPFSDDAEGPRARQLVYLDAQAALLGHFKTPSLRNVALTAPYMHAGQFATLADVVRHYSTLATAAEPADPTHVEALVAEPLALSEREIADVVAFLESLTSDDARAPGRGARAQ